MAKRNDVVTSVIGIEYEEFTKKPYTAVYGLVGKLKLSIYSSRVDDDFRTMIDALSKLSGVVAHLSSVDCYLMDTGASFSIGEDGYMHPKDKHDLEI